MYEQNPGLGIHRERPHDLTIDRSIKMMTNVFMLQLLLTFVVGSLWIYLTVTVSARLGSKIGGFIGGLPSTALLSFFFIGLTQSPEIASEATTVFPLAYGITGVFLVVYASIVKKGFVMALFYALIIWLFLSSLVALASPKSFALILIIYAVVLFLSYYLLEARLSVPSFVRVKINAPSKLTVVRSFFGGLTIVLAVLLAKLGGPVFGGIFAAFPAMFISILAITYKTYGVDYSKAMTKPLMITGMITIVIYAIAVRYLYVTAGLYIGTLFSIFLSAISAYFTYQFILHKCT
jgi:hypothetical protein